METTRKVKIAIIILVWNDYVNTRATINSVLNTKGCNYDIIIVDNASTNGCIDKIRNEFKNIGNIFYLINNVNWGYAEGNNIAIRYCMENGYDYFFILNNDVIFDSESCIYDMWKTMEDDNSIGIVSPLIWNKKRDGSFVKGKVMTDSKLYKFMMKMNGIKIGEYAVGKYLVPTVSGSFLAFSRRNIEINHGFEKNFFMYAEEDDLCIRTNMNGLKVVKLSKDYGIKHLGGILDFIAVADWKRVISQRNRLMLIRTFPFVQRVLYGFLLLVHNLVRDFKLLFKKRPKSALMLFISYFEGLYDLIFYNELSKTDLLFKRGQELAKASHIYHIKIQ